MNNWILVILLIVQCIYQISECTQTADQPTDQEKQVMSEKVYARLFRLRRKEKNQLLKILADEATYEKRFKLLEAGYEKLLTVLSQTKRLLLTSKYNPMVDKFPSDDKNLVEAISVTLENTCLFGEMLLHHPDMSYIILQRPKKSVAPGEWQDLINWCLKYTRYFYDRIIDGHSQTLLSLTDQEINPGNRLPNYANPYRARKEAAGGNGSGKKDGNKSRKKLKKGPQISRTEL